MVKKALKAVGQAAKRFVGMASEAQAEPSEAERRAKDAAEALESARRLALGENFVMHAPVAGSASKGKVLTRQEREVLIAELVNANSSWDLTPAAVKARKEARRRYADSINTANKKISQAKTLIATEERLIAQWEIQNAENENIQEIDENLMTLRTDPQKPSKGKETTTSKATRMSGFTKKRKLSYSVPDEAELQQRLDAL
jgi:hypothetical protein